MNAVVRFFMMLSEPVQMLRGFFVALLNGLPLDATWRFVGLPFVRRCGRWQVLLGRNECASSLSIGRRFRAISKLSQNSFGLIQRVNIRTISYGASLKIGDDVGVSGCTIAAASSVTIGNRVLIGSGAVIYDTDAHAIDPAERRANVRGKSAPIVIEDDVFIGARALVLKGVTIGRGSVVGAGAVVTKSVPPYSIVVGNPARIVGDSRKTGDGEGII